MGKNDDGNPDELDTSPEAIKARVDAANAEDEAGKKGDGGGDEDAGDGGDDDHSGDGDGDAGAGGDGSDDANNGDGNDDDGGDGGDDEGTGRRFTQFVDPKEDTDDAYISNLEKGYQNSSAEAIRLKGQLDEANAKLAGKGGDGSDGGDGAADGASDNPFVANLQHEWETKSTAEISEFIEANPEVVSDPKVAADVQRWMKTLSTAALKDEGRLMTGGEAMAAAYRVLGLEDKRKPAEDLATGAKKSAGTTRPRGKAPKGNSSKPKFTDAQLEMARNMGHSDPEKWLSENLSN